MMVETILISEHPSGTWDCCLGPFLLKLLPHLSYICLHSEIRTSERCSEHFFFHLLSENCW